MFDLEELKARFEFWKARRIKLREHYDFFFDVSEPNATAVKLLKKYPGVIVEFSDIEMQTDKDMSFNMLVIANPNLCDVESERFKNYTGTIFRSIILTALENAMKEYNENGNLDSLKSHSQRILHEEVTSVSEDGIPDRKSRKKAIRGNKKLHSEV
jgi:hypothetical protein